MSVHPSAGVSSQDSNTSSCHSIGQGDITALPSVAVLKELDPSPEKPVTTAR